MKINIDMYVVEESRFSSFVLRFRFSCVEIASFFYCIFISPSSYGTGNTIEPPVRVIFIKVSFFFVPNYENGAMTLVVEVAGVGLPYFFFKRKFQPQKTSSTVPSGCAPSLFPGVGK